jgi:RNA polymerase sigma-70 factor (ECF subfamily)
VSRLAADGIEPGARPPGRGLDELFEDHRVLLTGYCYRMLGSAFDADDAVQETLLRAWRSFDGYAGRGALRSWLYRIATNVCLDMLHGRQRRARPMDLTTPGDRRLGDRLPDSTWIEPVPDDHVLLADGDPAERAVARDTVRLAFIAALQYLPPRQRAVLILRDVLRWSAGEVAELLDTTVAGVTSALHRARATLRASNLAPLAPPLDDAQRSLVARYVDAFERFDIDQLVSLLHEDATLSMPPYTLWLRGPLDIHRWWVGAGSNCRGSRVVPVAANGSPAFAQWRATTGGPGFHAWAIHVIDVSAGGISDVTCFRDPTLFQLFEQPTRLDERRNPDGSPPAAM